MTDLLLPKLSLSMEEGRISEWLVAEGAEVRAGEPVAVVETDKAEVEVEAHEAGLLERAVEAGSIVAVESVIARITAVPAAGAPAPQPADPPDPDRKASPEPARERPRAIVGGGITAASLTAGPPPEGSFAAVGSAVRASARRTDADGVAASDGAPAAGERIVASPAARRRAGELGVDLATVAGRGPGGRIVAADVEDAASATVVTTPATVAATPPEQPEPAAQVGAYPTERLAAAAAPASTAAMRSVADLRPAVVGALVAGWKAIPHTNVGGELDADGLVAARKAAAVEVEKITYTDLLLLALARALRDVADLCGTVGADGAVTRSTRVDLNLAIATPAGVMAPAIVDVTSLGLGAIARERARLVGAARGGSLAARDLVPGVCTLSNLGAYPVDFFTPVLSGPQISLLATGRIAERVIARDGLIGIGHRMWANVCIDHRAADGEAGGRLLAALERRIADLAHTI